MLFISPPFGNYININNAKSISGSYTLHPREGLISQIFKTLRYSQYHNGWINKIGLRNKGIDWALSNVSENKILSVAILDPKDIPIILKKIPENRDIEINVSCPNAEKKMVSEGISKFINPKRKWCIIKISPSATNFDIDNYYNMGFRQFHCCNTIPLTNGGLSGPALIPYTTEKIVYLKSKYNDVSVIAGGGIRYINDIYHYKSIGANHFSVSTLLFNPLLFASFMYDFVSSKQ